MFEKQIGIDLGTANVLVYMKGRGIVLNEPSVVAIANSENRIVAVGNEARMMLGRTPGNITVTRPMRDGVIADYVITEAMLRYFIGKVCGRFRLVKPEVMICIPSGVTNVEGRAVHDAAIAAGARAAYLIPEPLAAALGANVPISAASGNLVIDIGGGTTEVAVISLNGIVTSHSVRVGGNRFDDVIAAYIKRRYNLMIGERTAEEIKINIGSAIRLEDELEMEVRGRDQLLGLPRTVTVRTNEIVDAIADPVSSVTEAVKTVLEQTPPELSSDVMDKGMVMTGGGSLLRNIDKLLTSVTGVPCHVAEHPLNCVALGTGRAMESFEIMRDSLLGM
ncbi:MAG TPA: rod shape-determining protein [Chloroflexota bacterium]|nr:rod shape-determining protein [Chloroflexota bacterium]